MEKLRVMIVDDDSLVAELLAELIEALCYEICAIEAGDSRVVAAAGSEKPDIMIIDAQFQSRLGAIETILAFGQMPHVFVSAEAPSVRTLRLDATVLQKALCANARS